MTEHSGVCRCNGNEARALAEARRATAAHQLHRNNCSMQPGGSMQASSAPLPLPPRAPRRFSPRTLQVTAAGRHDNARAELQPPIDPAVASRLQMAVNLKIGGGIFKKLFNNRETGKKNCIGIC